ncbi:MAG: hypothetical protein ACR2PB_14680, partial [Desulfocapsaceae bacterium]
LATWLSALKGRLPKRGDLDDILEKVLRASRFSEARAIMVRYLPQFVAVRYGEELQRLPLPRVIDNDPQAAPVVLIDCFDAALPEANGDECAEALASLAEQCQCLCFTDHSSPGWNLEAAQIVDIAALN